MTSIAQEKKEEINEIFKREKESEIPDYLKSSLAHYICILTSSYLENSLRYIILDYTERKCSDQSVRFGKNEKSKLSEHKRSFGEVRFASSTRQQAKRDNQ